MTQYSGVLKIVRFNWPWYVAIASATAAGILLLCSGAMHGRWAVVVVAGFLVADLWLLVSLAVSHYVYDRSDVSCARWLDSVDPTVVRRAGVFHAGQDEASYAVTRALPSAEVKAFDFYNPAHIGTPSLERARALAGRHDAAIACDNILLKNETLDIALLVFAAHEIRQEAERVAFFRELGRVLTPTGRVVIVEHVRDVWNFLAYGPGAFHFLSRQTWHRSFANGGLKLLRETPCTLFVRVFELGKAS